MRAGKRIALIPARSGSKRLPNKAIRLLNGHPIISYSICSCIDTFIFDEIIVSSDSEEYLEIARQYGAKTRLRPKEISGDHSPDVEWVKDVLDNLDYDPAYFAIIRPTNPFRTSETINKAWARFCLHGEADSLRAVEKTKHSPYKSWVLMSNGLIAPFAGHIIDIGKYKLPSYNCPTQLSPEVFVQNASLEISETRFVHQFNSITGQHILPFFTNGYEGWDLNTEDDLDFAHWLVEKGKAKLQEVRKA